MTMMLSQLKCLIFLSFCLLNNYVLCYCPACEQNNNFMNLMNSIRNYGNNGNNGNGGQTYGSNSNNFMGGSGFGSTANNGFNIEGGYGNGGSSGSSQWISQPTSTGYNSFGSTSNGISGLSGINGISGIGGSTSNNGFGISGFTTNGNSNFNAIPVRIITTGGGGYGCCNMNSFGPCCQPQTTFTQPQTFSQPQSFNTFIPNHSSFGGVQANPSNDVPGPIPHASYSPPSSPATGLSSSSATVSSPQLQAPIYDYGNTVQNNVPFSPQPKQNDATPASSTFDFYPQQHVNTNQYLSAPSSPYQSQQQQPQTQEFQYYKNPYGSAAF